LASFLIITVYAQGTDNNEDLYDEDFGIAEGVTIYGQRPIDVYVLDQINGLPSERKQFIETDFLRESGFQSTGSAKYRKTTSSEKAISLLSDAFCSFSLVLASISKKPFYEMEYDRLPNGKFYTFEAVFIKSKFTNVLPEVLTVIELEYMLQIEFCNGILIRDNANYYTDENINKFEKLIYKLPDYPENIVKAKNRYFNELQKIKATLERNRNPSENYLRAIKNLGHYITHDAH